MTLERDTLRAEALVDSLGALVAARILLRTGRDADLLRVIRNSSDSWTNERAQVLFEIRSTLIAAQLGKSSLARIEGADILEHSLEKEPHRP